MLWMCWLMPWDGPKHLYCVFSVNRIMVIANNARKISLRISCKYPHIIFTIVVVYVSVTDVIMATLISRFSWFLRPHL